MPVDNPFRRERMFQQIRLTVSVAGCLLSISSLVQGQINTASLLGTVTDPTGAVVSGATVIVENVGTRGSQTTQTDGSGSYAIERLPVGEYTLTVTAPGFKRFQRTEIKLDATQ